MKRITTTKPCPFCGGKNTYSTGNAVRPYYYRVRCASCQAETGYKRSRAAAARAWNRRAP